MGAQDNLPSNNSSNTLNPSPLMRAAADCFNKPDAAEDTLVVNGSATWQDFFATFIQWGRRLLNISPNGMEHQGESTGADDTQNHHNPFLKLIYNTDGNAESGLNYTGLGFLFSSVIGGFIIGTVIKIFQNLRKLQLNSYQYTQQQIAKIHKKNDLGYMPDDELSTVPSKAEINQAFSDILESEKIKSLYHYKVKSLNSSTIVLERLGARPTPPPPPKAVIKHTRSNILVRGINWLQNTTIAKAAHTAWNRISKYSFIYWLVSLPMLLIFGSMGFPALLPALITTLGIGLGLAVWKSKKHIKTIHAAINNKISQQDNNEIDDVPESDKRDDHDRVLLELKQRYYEKSAHKATMSALARYKEKQKITTLSLQQQAIKKSTFIEGDMDTESLGEQEETLINIDNANDVEAVLNSEIAQRLLGSKAERRARWFVSGAKDAIGAFVEFAFITGFGADLSYGMTAAGGILATIFTPVSHFLGGSLLMAAGGLVMGAIFGIKTLAQVHQEQLIAEQKVYQALTAPYQIKSGRIINGKPEYVNAGITIKEKIEQLEKSINDTIGRIKTAKTALTSDQLNNIPHYNLNNINAFNHDRFEKQREKIPFKTKCKKIANRIFTGLTGGQTGVLIARLLFLTGCVFAGALVGSVVGAPLAFGLIATGFALFMGGLKLAKSILDKRNGHREHCVNTLNSRVSYLKKKEKELNELEQIINHESQLSIESTVTKSVIEIQPKRSEPVLVSKSGYSTPKITPVSSIYRSGNSSTHFQPSNGTGSFSQPFIQDEEYEAGMKPPSQASSLSSSGMTCKTY